MERVKLKIKKLDYNKTLNEIQHVPEDEGYRKAVESFTLRHNVLIPPYMEPVSERFYKIGANFASAGAGALVETFQGSNLCSYLRYDHNYGLY